MQWWKGQKIIKQDGVTLNAICKYYPLYSGKRRSLKEAMMFSLACFKLMKEDFDIIDADHMPHLVLFPLKLICIIKRKPLIGTWNEVWGRKYWISYIGILGNIGAFIENLSYYMPDQIIAISLQTAQALRSANIKRHIEIIPYGIDLEEIENVKKATIHYDVLYAGRLLAHKNVELLLNAISIVKQKNQYIQCCIIGEGPEKENLNKQIINLHLQENVKLLPFFPKHNDLLSYMKASKVFVLPSIREGLGIVVLEANACGLPVITIDDPNNAAKNLIIKSINGYVSKHDDNTLANVIQLSLLKQLNTQQIQTYLKEYSWKILLNKLESVYSL